jgi:hypothetical protein
MKLGVALLLASLAAACDEVDGAASEGVWDGGGGILDEDPLVTSLGYQTYYRNEDQKDTNNDGIGDMCSAWVEITNLKQKHYEYNHVFGFWNGTASWKNYITPPWILGQELPYTTNQQGDFVDPATGLPIRKKEDPKEAANSGYLEELCDYCGGSFVCKVRKKTIRPAQQLDFDVIGFSIDPYLTTTVGACSCATPEKEDCFGIDEYCARPDISLLESDIEQYLHQAAESEYYESGRPRYAGFRNKGNRPKMDTDIGPDLQGQVITEACQKGDDIGQLFFELATESNYWSTPGWGVNDPVKDGCQEIDMTFKNGDHRRARWLYPGQVEPNPEPDDLAGWLNDYPDGKGEQKWMDGHTTAMRVGLMKYIEQAPPYRTFWHRQWHTPPTSSNNMYTDQDRPLPESLFDGYGGYVVYETDCTGTLDPCDPGKVVPEIHLPWGGLIKPKPDLDTFLTKVLPTPDGSGVELHLALLHRGSGDLEQVKETYDVVGSGFPAQRFSVLDLTMDTETAQRLFGMSMDGGGVFAAAAVIVEPVDPVVPRVRLVVGGATADGAPSSTSVWISRSWDARPTFRPLVSGLETGWVLDPNVVVDSIHERLLLVGGETADGPVDRMVWFDFKTLGSGTWFAQGERKVQVPLPPDASAGRLASDTAGNRAFAVAGGRTGAAVFEFGWQSAVPWVRELTPATGPVPTPRKGAAVAWSSSRGSVLLYGGMTEVPDEGGVVERMNGELWGFDPRRRAWSPILDSGSALGRRDAMLSPGRTEVYLAGGCDASGGLPADSVLALRRTADGRGEARALAPSTLSVLQAGAAPHESVFRSAAPLAYSLRSNPGTERTSGSTVRVELDDPTGSLRLVALSPTGSGARGGETALSLSLHAGEEWTVRVVPRKGKEAQAEGAAFRVFATPAEKGASLGSVSTTPLARFDAEGDILAVCRPNKLSLHRRQGDSLVAAGSVSLTVAADVDIQGHLAFVAEFPKGLKVVDISDPAAPVVVGSEWVLGFVDSVAVIGSRAYLGAGPFGVQVVDVSDPTDPRWVDTIDTGDVVVDVSATGGLLLVSKLISGEVEVHRVERSGAVAKIGEYQSRGWIDDALVAGYTLYVRDKLGRLEVVDFRSPSSPKRLETLTGGGREEVSSRWGGRMVAEPGLPNKVRVYDVRAAVGE